MRRSPGRRASASPAAPLGPGRRCVGAILLRADARYQRIAESAASGGPSRSSRCSARDTLQRTPTEYDRRGAVTSSDAARRWSGPRYAHSGARNVLEIGSGTGRSSLNFAARPRCRVFGVRCRAGDASPTRTPNTASRISATRWPTCSNPTLPATYEFAYSIDMSPHPRPARLPPSRAAGARARRPFADRQPNILHPYIYVHQSACGAPASTRPLPPWRFEPLMREAGFTVTSRRYASLSPAASSVSPVLGRVEHALEPVPLIGGSVVSLLRARTTAARRDGINDAPDPTAGAPPERLSSGASSASWPASAACSSSAARLADHGRQLRSADLRS